MMYYLTLYGLLNVLMVYAMKRISDKKPKR